MSSRPASTVRAVERAIDILACFTAGPPALEIGDLQRRTRLSRPTLYRLLQTLQAKGFIRSSGAPLRFELGPGLRQLTAAFDRSFPVVTRSAPTLERLWRDTGETIALMLPASGYARTCVVELRSAQPISFGRGTGYTDPMHKGASGKAILAFLDAIEQAEALELVEPARVRDALRAELARIRKAGYAITRGELVNGVCAIGAPVVDAAQRVHASICVFGPQPRMTGRHLDRCIKAVLAASRAVGARL